MVEQLPTTLVVTSGLPVCGGPRWEPEDGPLEPDEDEVAAVTADRQQPRWLPFYDMGPPREVFFPARLLC